MVGPLVHLAALMLVFTSFAWLAVRRFA